MSPRTNNSLGGAIFVLKIPNFGIRKIPYRFLIPCVVKIVSLRGRGKGCRSRTDQNKRYDGRHTAAVANKHNAIWARFIRNALFETVYPNESVRAGLWMLRRWNRGVRRNRKRQTGFVRTRVRRNALLYTHSCIFVYVYAQRTQHGDVVNGWRRSSCTRHPLRPNYSRAKYTPRPVIWSPAVSWKRNKIK